MWEGFCSKRKCSKRKFCDEFHLGISAKGAEPAVHGGGPAVVEVKELPAPLTGFAPTHGIATCSRDEVYVVPS
jgi:hypothetical protein